MDALLFVNRTLHIKQLHHLQRIEKETNMAVFCIVPRRSTASMTLPATAPTGCPLSTCLRDATDWETRHSLFGWVWWIHTRTLCSGSRLLLAHLKSGIRHSTDPIQTQQPDLVNNILFLSFRIQEKKSINQQGSVVEVDLKFSSVKDFETFKCKLKSGREESQDMQLSLGKSTVLLLALTFDLTVDRAYRKNISLLEYKKEKLLSQARFYNPSRLNRCNIHPYLKV